MRAPAFGIAVLTPVLLAGAVAATPQGTPAAVPAAAPAPTPAPARPVAAAPKPLTALPAGLRIPAKAMSAYRAAERTMADAAPDCGISWNLLAGIGRIEPAPNSGDATAVRAIYARTPGGKAPSATWSRFASDGDGDGKSDPMNPFDATLATARHLCSSGLDLRNPSQVLTALLRYNNSLAFAENVLGWAAAYATGTAPLNLPPIYGSVPVLGPYLPGVWGLSQATLVMATGTQAGYLLPGQPPIAVDEALPAQSLPEPEVAALPEPAPVVLPRSAGAAELAAAPAAAAAAAGRNAAPQPAVLGERPRVEPTEAFSPPEPPAPQVADFEPPAAQLSVPEPPAAQLSVPEPPAPLLDVEPPAPQVADFETPAVADDPGRATGRGSAQSPGQASGGNDGGGNAGGARRGAKNDG